MALCLSPLPSQGQCTFLRRARILHNRSSRPRRIRITTYTTRTTFILTQYRQNLQRYLCLCGQQATRQQISIRRHPSHRIPLRRRRCFRRASRSRPGRPARGVERFRRSSRCCKGQRRSTLQLDGFLRYYLGQIGFLTYMMTRTIQYLYRASSRRTLSLLPNLALVSVSLHSFA